MILQIAILSFLSCFSNPTLVKGDSKCQAWLVQSIPTDMPDLPRISGVLSTSDVLQWLAGNSSESLNIVAQYWQLIASPNDTSSGDYGFTADEMSAFGAYEGAAVYNAVLDAADRNVSIRLLQHSGVYPDFTKEPSEIAFNRSNVESVTLILSKWWGSGIVHTKLWTSNNRDAYIGSANNDWKSLTQVKETGIYLVDCHHIVKKIEKYFKNLWTLGSLDPSFYVTTAFDERGQVNRTVPCWSHFVDNKRRCRSPLHKYKDIKKVRPYPILAKPDTFDTKIETPGINYPTNEEQRSYLSFAPPELLFDEQQTDEQGWLETIESVSTGGTVRISTMDWLEQSQYTKYTVFWPTLASAISKVMFSKHAKVRLIVAYWAHFINNTDVYLKSLLNSNALCSSAERNKCAGEIEIRYYLVPGYNETGPAVDRNGTSTGNAYPAYSRVNHGKYAVSDMRAHIGTSNLMWDYFFTTSGLSFGTDNAAIVHQLQEIFDADWNSPYAVNVDDFDTSQPVLHAQI